MSVLATVLTVLLWVSCVLIVVVVLLQTGKGGGMGGMFGGGAGPESLLGTRAASFLVKVTVALCLIFLAICLTLGRLGKRTLSRAKYEAAASETATTGTVTPESTEESGGTEENAEN